MLSSDKNIETITQLVEMVKHNFELRKEYAKLDVVENGSTSTERVKIGVKRLDRDEQMTQIACC